MTEEQNKLAEEIEKFLAENTLSGYPRTLMEKSVAALREREPATEAVLEISDERIREIAEAEVNPAYDANVQIITYVTRVVRSVLVALKGKGASQGDAGMGTLRIFKPCEKHKDVTSWTVHPSGYAIPALEVCPVCEEIAYNLKLSAPDEQKG